MLPGEVQLVMLWRGDGRLPETPVLNLGLGGVFQEFEAVLCPEDTTDLLMRFAICDLQY